MNREKLIKTYFEFFKAKDHKEVGNAPLLPENDPTVLFTTAGMHPLVPFLLGQKHPQGKRLVSVQKCIRTGDIDEVGDETHHTFFEMLGNWSLEDYGKKEAIAYSYEFLTSILKIPKEKITVTCFAGDKDAPKDSEAAKAWKKVGITKIKFLGKKDNWWGPAGTTGPCGPDTEMFVDDVEIWNDVFMQYEKTKEGEYIEAKQKNIDTGMGVERTLAILNGYTDSYQTEIWLPIIKKIEKHSGKKYEKNKKAFRIIADHLKASVMILAEKIPPSNKEHGYVLRRLIRRALTYANQIGLSESLATLAEAIFEIYRDYKHIHKNKSFILKEIKEEEEKFLRTLEKGLTQFTKMTALQKNLSGKDAFLLYQSFGFPKEMIKEVAQEKKISFNEKEFHKELEAHQKLSQTASKGRFSSGLADNSVTTTRLHTATHLLHEALKRVLKDKAIEQKGSNINSERLRFDFSFSRKLEQSEIEAIEQMVNEQIKKGHAVIRKEMSPEKAKKEGAVGLFGEKYGDTVSVYTIGNFSKEICTGPHVTNTQELGRFKITKEESSSAGVRRIKAVLENPK